MGFFNNFPYTNFHEMNDDWILKEFLKLREYVKEYTALNSVGYAGVWDITKQYPQWSIVSTGDKTYLSKTPVPTGIDINNEDFWLQMSDLDPRIGDIINSIGQLQKEFETYVAENPVLDLTKFEGEDLYQHYTGDFNGIVLLPKTCTLSNTITITTPCYIFGFDSVVNSAVANCFSITANDCTVNGVFFNYSGRTVDPDSANNTVVSITGNRVEIANCRFELFPSSAVSVASENVVIDNCLIQNLKSSYIAALWFGKSSNRCLIKNCKILNNYLDGAHVEGAYITFNSCTISKNGLRPSSGSGAIGACGIYGGKETNNRPYGLVVTGCAIDQNSEAGIDVGCAFGRFVNNSFSSNALNGITLESNYKNIISGNIFNGNGTYGGTVDAYRKASIGSAWGVFSLNLTNNLVQNGSAESYYIDFLKTTGNNQVITGNICENGRGYSTATDSTILIVNNIPN